MNFFDRLYLGFEGEQYIMSQLFGIGYEGFKLPGDFGFDILVTNQKELSLGPRIRKGRNIQPPYALQVKSRRVDDDYEEGPAGRPQVKIPFSLSPDEFQRIQNENKGFLVCVAFIKPPGSPVYNKAFSFWLHGSHLGDLNRKGYITYQQQGMGDKPCYELMVCIRLEPTIETVAYTDQLVRDGYLNEKGRQRMMKDLGPKLPPSWKASAYTSLCRSTRDGRGGIVMKKIPDDITRLINLGINVSLSNLD